MKKMAWIILCLLLLPVLCSCGAKEQTNMENTDMQNTDMQTVTVINALPTADIWLLPETEANRKTTLWGLATVAKVQTGEARLTPLCQPGDDGLYMLRVIDTDNAFYAVDYVALQAGWTVKLAGDDPGAVTAAVTDETGALQQTYEVFAARL